ncbi:hypothetical protein AMTR_s00033p00243500 [Amborella trichopoda]|uniref:Reticulon-like protein n=1 Tax=Amborella trichopoda TaxID=13333 RepID=U5CMQ8_AMBTC|nr:hypothetical protein AMTR_s00033p00243500 [Amborella trichopoda]
MPTLTVTPADVFLWRRKKLSFSVLVAATLTWLLFDKVGYTPITMVSWVALFVVTVVFVSAHMASLFNRELPPIPKLEIKEQWTAEMASVLSERLNNIARWVHEMGTRRDYMRFARVVAGLGLLSVTGSWFDTLTTVYISESFLPFPVEFISF